MDLRRLRAKLRNQAEKRSELVVKIKDRIDPRVRSLQDELFELAIEAILNELEFKDGKIVGGVNNMSRVNRMQFMGQFYGKESAGMGFINWLLGALVKINGATMSYFRSFKDPKFPAVSEQVERAMFNRIGFDPVRSILIPGGYFDNLINDVKIEREVKRILTGSIVDNTSFKDIRNRVREAIQGGEAAGLLKKQYIETGIYDIAAEHDRVINGQMANDLGLEHFIYGGPTLKTTREFCLERVGNVYSVSEAQRWEGLTWKGKNPSCPILQCLGGYNCQHTPDYITFELARMLRPDVPEN